MVCIIGLTGRAGAGKDTLADYLSEYLSTRGNYNVTRQSFASPIRKIASELGFCGGDRKQKEKCKTVVFDDFESSLIESIENSIGDLIVDEDAASLFSYVVEELKEQKLLDGEKLSISPRQLMQIIGTEGGRSVRELFWIDICLEKVLDAERDGADVAIVEDVRSEDEAEQVDVLFYIDRPGLPPVSAHSSENNIERIADTYADGSVSNSGTLRDLELSAAALGEMIIDKHMGQLL